MGAFIPIAHLVTRHNTGIHKVSTPLPKTHTPHSPPTQLLNKSIRPRFIVTCTSSKSNNNPHHIIALPATKSPLWTTSSPAYPINPSHSSSSHAHGHSALQSAPLRACQPQALARHRRSGHRSRRLSGSPLCCYPCAFCGDEVFG